MVATSPIGSPKPRKWRRRTLLLAAIIGFVSACVLVEIWIVTRNWTNIYSFSKHAHHLELRAGAGHLIIVHASNWWTDTAPQHYGDNVAPNLNLDEWIGFDVQSTSRFASCQFATGEYHPPLIDESKVVFSPHFHRGESVRFKVWLIPIWIPTVVCALPGVWWLIQRRQWAKSN